MLTELHTLQQTAVHTEQREELLIVEVKLHRVSVFFEELKTKHNKQTHIKVCSNTSTQVSTFKRVLRSGAQIPQTSFSFLSACHSGWKYIFLEY